MFRVHNRPTVSGGGGGVTYSATASVRILNVGCVPAYVRPKRGGASERSGVRSSVQNKARRMRCRAYRSARNSSAEK